MAQISRDDFQRAVSALVEHFGVAQTRDRLATIGAFRSRRGLNSGDALADRLFRLSGGLRLQVGATAGFMMLWGEMLNERLGEDGQKGIEDLADQVNECLDEGEALIAGKEQALDEALDAYRKALADAVGPTVAEIDMLLKAVPDVAARLRSQSAERGADAPASDSSEPS